jgi:hypothetical protein
MACGKTRNRQALAHHFGTTVVIDDWDPRHHKLVRGALHLTNVEVKMPELAEVHLFANIAFDPTKHTQILLEQPLSKRTYV